MGCSEHVFEQFIYMNGVAKTKLFVEGCEKNDETLCKN